MATKPDSDRHLSIDHLFFPPTPLVKLIRKASRRRRHRPASDRPLKSRGGQQQKARRQVQ